jgi:hypothetical protein
MNGLVIGIMGDFDYLIESPDKGSGIPATACKNKVIREQDVNHKIKAL